MGVLSLVAFLFVSFPSIPDAYAAEVTLAWDPNTEPDIAGYILYCDTLSRQCTGSYADSIDVGNQTTYTVSGLEEGATYYFAVIAYDVYNRSDFSAELRYEVPEGNPAPVVANDAFSVDEDTRLGISAPGVLGNDSDADGDALTAAGTLALNVDGSFTYAPSAGFSGTYGFAYKASDGVGESMAGTVNITAGAVNEAPVAEDDAYSVDQDRALTTPPPGVLSNDSDADGDALTGVLVSGPSNGTLVFNPDGSFTYTPSVDFSGTDGFTYKASDGVLESTPATVSITVNPIAPVVSTTVYEDAEDGSTSGWEVYRGPDGAQISNVVDEDRGNRVIQLSGSGWKNGYWLRSADLSRWGNPSQFTITWSVKYAEEFEVYIVLQTSTGRRYLGYRSIDDSPPGGGKLVEYGLGSGVADGRWHSFSRDLEADLRRAQPDVVLLEVDAFGIRGSGRVDDIMLSRPALPPLATVAIPIVPLELLFRAVPGDMEITLNWESDPDILGFHVFRSAHRDGDYVRITRELLKGEERFIPAKTYAYVDRDVIPGSTCWYKFEEASMDGSTTLIGPISAMLPIRCDINDLAVSSLSERFIVLNWTVPSTGSASSSIASYVVELGHQAPSSQRWNPTQRMEVDGTAASGSEEEVKITGLRPGIPYYLSVRGVDGEGRMCPRSNIVSTATLAAFVDEDLDVKDPYIIRDGDSLFVADNDEELTFTWSSWASLGAVEYEVQVRSHGSGQVEHTATVQDTVFSFRGEPQDTYFVEVVPMSGTGERLGAVESRSIRCAPVVMDVPGRVGRAGR